MPNWKIIVICVLGLGIVVSSITLVAKQKALNDNIAAAAKLKEQSKQLEDGLSKMQVASSQLESENAQLKKEVEALREGRPVESQVASGEDESRRLIRRLENDLKRKQREFDVLKEKHDSLQESPSVVTAEVPDASQDTRGGRRQRFTPEQREQFVASRRDRMFDMMDRRIEEAPTDYEAGLLVDIEQRFANMATLREKRRNATAEERQAIEAEMAAERRALADTYNEYDSYQWRSLADKYGVTDVDQFVEQARGMSRSRQFQWFGGPGPQVGPPEGFRRRQR